jgi:hypothetical protein
VSSFTYSYVLHSRVGILCCKYIQYIHYFGFSAAIFQDKSIDSEIWGCHSAEY